MLKKNRLEEGSIDGAESRGKWMAIGSRRYFTGTRMKKMKYLLEIIPHSNKSESPRITILLDCDSNSNFRSQDIAFCCC